MPSYTFVSTANAFVLRGAKIVFVDIRPDTMNIDETLIEAAITDKILSVIAASISVSSIFMVSGRISTKTIFAPRNTNAFAVETKV